MSKRKPPAVATIAAGRRVVLSAGTLDGPFLAALQRLNLCPNGHIGDQVSTSTWGPGVDQVKGDDDGTDKTT